MSWFTRFHERINGKRNPGLLSGVLKANPRRDILLFGGVPDPVRRAWTRPRGGYRTQEQVDRDVERCQAYLDAHEPPHTGPFGFVRPARRRGPNRRPGQPNRERDRPDPPDAPEDDDSSDADTEESEPGHAPGAEDGGEPAAEEPEPGPGPEPGARPVPGGRQRPPGQPPNNGGAAGPPEIPRRPRDGGDDDEVEPFDEGSDVDDRERQRPRNVHFEPYLLGYSVPRRGPNVHTGQRRPAELIPRPIRPRNNVRQESPPRMRLRGGGDSGGGRRLGDLRSGDESDGVEIFDEHSTVASDRPQKSRRLHRKDQRKSTERRTGGIWSFGKLPQISSEQHNNTPESLRRSNGDVGNSSPSPPSRTGSLMAISDEGSETNESPNAAHGPRGHQSPPASQASNDSEAITESAPRGDPRRLGRIRGRRTARHSEERLQLDHPNSLVTHIDRRDTSPRRTEIRVEGHRTTYFTQDDDHDMSDREIERHVAAAVHETRDGETAWPNREGERRWKAELHRFLNLLD